MFLSLLDLLRQGGAFPGGTAGTAPVIELADQGDHLLLRAALQGIDPKSVQIQLAETSMAIGGQRTVEEQTEGPDFISYQSAVSQFYRELPLPCRVDPRRAAAHWQGDGVLLVTMPKA